MSMYEVYSNLKSCIEDIERGGSLDAHIAIYILSHHEEIPELSIGELAAACNTSPATISRFCRRVNDCDFRSLKDQIEEYNAWLRSEPARNRSHLKIDLPWYFDMVESSLYETRDLLDDALMDRAVDWLSAATNVYAYGSSFSNLAAQSLCEKLSRINCLCYSFSTVKGQLASMGLLERGDVVVLVSFSGTTRHIVDLYRKAKVKGCKIIWISSNRTLGQGAEASELLIPVSSVTLPEYSTALVEGISLQSAINALYICYTNRLCSGAR